MSTLYAIYVAVYYIALFLGAFHLLGGVIRFVESARDSYVRAKIDRLPELAKWRYIQKVATRRFKLARLFFNVATRLRWNTLMDKYLDLMSNYAALAGDAANEQARILNPPIIVTPTNDAKQIKSPPIFIALLPKGIH